MCKGNEPVTRLGIVGYGGMGRWHAFKSDMVECIEVAGVYDIDPKRMEKAANEDWHIYESLEQMLADPTVELVTVAIPNHLHLEVCVKAMEAGKHVVCEKPVALNSQQLEEMIDVSRRTGTLFTVHQNRRWDEDFLIVKKLLEENTLGQVFRIESRVHGSRGVPGDWRHYKRYGGGMVLDWGVHLLDQALLLTDSPLKKVYAQLTYVTGGDCDDGFTAQLTFENGLTMEVQVGTSNFISLPRWYVLGTNGSAVINTFRKHDGKVVMVSDWEKRDAAPVVTAAGLTKTMAPRTEETIREYPLPHVDSDVRDFYRNVCAVIHGHGECLVCHHQVRRVMRLMEAVFRSAETGSVVEFE